MTPAEIKALAAPISEEDPCGPDLDMVGDADYMRFTARIEGVLPKSFAKFDRSEVDFPAEFATLKSLLGRSRDLRLMVFLAKLEILNRDIEAFVTATETIAALLDQFWEKVQPELLDGDAILRIVSLQTLDDLPDAVFPLQSAPLFETRRFGKVSYRAHLLANGLIPARLASAEGERDEEVPSPDALRAALTDAELAHLIASRDQMIRLKEALDRIQSITNEKSDQPGAVKFEKITPLAQEIAVYLDGAVAARDPSLALTPASAGETGEEEGQDEAGAGPSGPVRSIAEAGAALAASATYFAKTEPSSPVLLVIAQAEALVGRSFYESMQALLPEMSAQAAISIGKDMVFKLPLDRLSSLSVTTASDPEEAASDSSDGWGSPASDDGWSSSESSSDDSEGDSSDGWSSGEETASDGAEDSGASEDAGDAPAEEEAASAGDGSSTEAAEEAVPKKAVSAPAHTATVFKAVNRQQAVALLNQVAAYFRAVEPSSPVPALLDHAGKLAGRDFFSLLREVLPASALRVDE